MQQITHPPRPMLHINRITLPAITSALALAIVSAARPADAHPAGIKQWSGDTPLAPLSSPALQSAPGLAMTGSVSLLAYTDSRNSAPDIYAGRWNSSVKAPDQRVSNQGPALQSRASAQASPVIEADGRAFVAFSDSDRVVLARQDAGSAPWAKQIFVSADGQWSAVARNPDMAGDGAGGLVIAWEDYRNTTESNRAPDIYATRCDGAAMTCAAEQKINIDLGPAEQRNPRVALIGAAVLVVWEDHRERGPDGARIYARYSPDGGASWGAEARLNLSATGGLETSDPNAATNPVIAWGNDGVPVVAWEAHRGGATGASYVAAARFVGGAWSMPVQVNSGTRRASQPALSSGPAGTFIAWSDGRSGARDSDIYAARWNGAGWTESRVTSDSARQSAPAIAVGASQARIAWLDERGGAPAIYSAWWDGAAWGGAQLSSDAIPRAANQRFPAIESALGGTYAAFVDMRQGPATVPLARLEGAANPPSWTLVSALPTGHDLQTQPVGLAATPDALHAAWVERTDAQGDTIIHASYSTNGWSQPRVLSSNPPGQTHGRNTLALAGSAGGMIAATWLQDSGNNTQQLFAAWLKDGAWSAQTAILPVPKDMWNANAVPAIDAAGQLHVAWGESDVNGRGRIMLATRNLNTGGAWAYSQVSPPVPSDWCEQGSPYLRADSGGRLHIAWFGCAPLSPPALWPHAGVIFYAFSDNNGASWSTPLRLAQLMPGEYTGERVLPVLAVSGPGEATVLYPAPSGAGYAFFAVTIKDNVAESPVQLGSANAGWLPAGNYAGAWHGGDGHPALGFDSARRRMIAIWPDRRDGRTTQLFNAALGDGGLIANLTVRAYLPLIKRQS